MVGCWKIFSDLVSDSGSEPYSMSVEICKIFYKYVYNTKGQCDKNEKPIKMCSLNWNWLELELVPLLFHQWPSIWDHITLTHVVIIVTLIILNWIELNLLVSFFRSTHGIWHDVFNDLWLFGLLGRFKPGALGR